jgi:hypothetical protein
MLDATTQYAARLRAIIGLVQNSQITGQIPKTVVLRMNSADISVLLANRKTSEERSSIISGALPDSLRQLIDTHYIIPSEDGRFYWEGFEIVQDDTILTGSIAFSTFKTKIVASSFVPPPIGVIPIKLATGLMLIQFGILSLLYLISAQVVSNEIAALLIFLSIAAIIISMKVTSKNSKGRPDVGAIHECD